MTDFDWTFPTVAERDWYLDRRFPERKALDQPGQYRIPTGGGLAVFRERVTFCGDAADTARATIVAVWKEEDEVDGQPVGPFEVYLDADSHPVLGRPYDPDAPTPRWITLTNARAIAAEHGVELTEN